MHPGYALLACVEQWGYTDLPDFVEVKYLDDLDFFNLTKKEIPEQIVELPVLTLKENNKHILYVNFNRLTENEYYTIELMLSQLIKIMMENDNNIQEFKKKCKNTFLQKNIEYGSLLFLEYKELSLLMSIMYSLYNSTTRENHNGKGYTYQKLNPYSPKETKKIAIKMLKRSLEEKQGQEKISTIIYAFSRFSILNSYKTSYDYSNIIKQEKTLKNIKLFNEILTKYDYTSISKELLNQLGSLGKILQQPTPIET